MNKVKDFFKKIALFFKSLFVSVNDKEPKLLTAVKKEGVQTALSSILCAIVGVFFGFLILLIIEPSEAFTGIKAILRNFLYWQEPKQRLSYFGDTIARAVPVIACGISVLFAYKTGLFNIGVAGQYCVGMCMCLVSAVAWKMPWIVSLLLAFVGGALWGAISGALKAFFNVNEVIACIMTNWIGLYLTNIVLADDSIKNPKILETVAVSDKCRLPNLGLDKLFGGNTHVTIAVLLVIVLAIVVDIILNKTTFGFELKATGNNKNAAKYAGMKEKRNIVLTMAISGGIAGIAASFFYLTGIAQWEFGTSVPSMGFDGIAVAFLGGLNPYGVIFAGYFVQHVTRGGTYLDTTYYNPEVAQLIIAIIIYLCAFMLFFKQFIQGRIKKSEDKKLRKQEKQLQSAIQEEKKEVQE